MPAFIRPAIVMVVLGATIALLALEMPHSTISNVALTVGSYSLAVGLMLGVERFLRMRSNR